jgi:hypothetical protein
MVFSIRPKGPVQEIRDLLHDADTSVRMCRLRKAFFLLAKAMFAIARLGITRIGKKGGDFLGLALG